MKQTIDMKETIFETAVRNNDIKTIRELIDNGLDVNINGWSRFHYTCCYRCYDIILLLLKNGLDVNVKGGDYGWTPLHLACYWGYYDVVHLLLKSGADINIKTNDGWTPLHVAFVWSYCDVARIFLPFSKEEDDKITISRKSFWRTI